MSKVKFIMSAALVLGSSAAFAGKDSTFKFQNSVRVGYDDNIYLARDGNQQETAFVTDIINITGKMAFSSRSDLTFYWQPEFRYRLDADPKFISYQDLYARFSHAISQRTFLTLSDRFRYQQKDGQSDLAQTENQNFLENDLLASLDFTLNSLSQIVIGGGYEFRAWDDDDYGQGTSNNDYDQIKANGAYVRELRPNSTSGSLGINYVNHEYAGSRGGFDTTSLYGGVDHNFSAKSLGTIQLGASSSTVDGASGSEDSTTPFFQGGWEYNPTERTSYNTTLGYSLYRSENTVFNAQERFNIGLGVRHDLTGKISLSTTLSYIHSFYDSAYAQAGAPEDAVDQLVTLAIRGSYQINRNNFLDLGYELSLRDSDSPFLQEYGRNRFDFGWRLRL